MLFLFYVLSMLDRQILALMVDPIKRDLGISDLQVSLLLGFSFAILYSITALPMGWVVDNKPRRPLIFWGVAVWGAATASCGLATTYAHLFLSRVFVGIGEATLSPAAYSTISDAFPRKRVATALAIYSIGAGVGAGIALSLGGVIIQTAVGHADFHLPLLGLLKPWQLIFLAVGVVSVAAAGLIYLVPEPPRTGKLRAGPVRVVTTAEALAFIKSRRRFWILFFLAFTAMNMALNSIISWAPSYLGRFFGWSHAQLGVSLAAIIVFAGGSGHIFSGLMIDRMLAKGREDAHVRYFFFALLIGAPLTIVGLTSPHIAIFLAGLCVFFFLLATNAGVASATIQYVTPNELRGRMSALYLFFSNVVGLGLGPTLVALVSRFVLHDEVRLGNALAVVVAGTAVVGLPAFHFARKSMRDAADDARTWA